MSFNKTQTLFSLNMSISHPIGNKIIRIIIACFCILLVLVVLAAAAYITLYNTLEPYQKAEKLLSLAPLIDGYDILFMI